jgi:hypothetical protein
MSPANKCTEGQGKAECELLGEGGREVDQPFVQLQLLFSQEERQREAGFSTYPADIDDGLFEK